MEIATECLFCKRNDLDLYEVNNNSILIDRELIDFSEIFLELFFAKINNDVTEYICEVCKDLVTQFYMFKKNARENLSSSFVFLSVYERFKEFLEAISSEELVVKVTDTKFVVSLRGEEEELLADHLIEEVEDEYIEEIHNSADEDHEYFEEIKEEDIRVPEKKKRKISKLEESAVEVYENVETSRSYRCHCDAELGSLEDLQKHMSIHKRTRLKSKLQCCGVDFKDLKCFEIHERSHENFEAIASRLDFFSCIQCRLVFSMQEDLETHAAQHEDVETEPGYLIERKGAFLDHICGLNPESKSPEQFEEIEENLSTCGHCGKRLSENALKVHFLFFHVQSIQCPLDNRIFMGAKQVRSFSDHIRNKHPELFDRSNLFACRHCQENFATNFEKLAHMKTCEKKVFICQDHCDKRFASDWLLKSHLKHVNGDGRFICEVCQKRCISKSDLQIHFRAHTNERPYECPICNKTFKTSANRASHLDIHEKTKKHECLICGEKFRTRPILRKHKKKHDTSYQEECVCKICEKKYASKPHLLRHLKSSHGAEDNIKCEDIASFFEERLVGQFADDNDRSMDDKRS